MSSHGSVGHDPVRYLQQMTSEMNHEMSRGSPPGAAGRAHHPLQRRLGGSDTGSRDRVNLGEHATTTVPLAAPQLSNSPRIGGSSRDAGQRSHHKTHRITGRIDEGDELAYDEEHSRISSGDHRMDEMLTEAQHRESARKFNAKAADNDELSFQARNLQLKLQEVEEECMRYSIALQGEVKEKRKLELRNADLSSKLADARQGLRDTQAALTNVQQATEQLIQKRDHRDSQLQRVLAENKLYEARVYELESNLRNAETSVKTLTANRDELIEKLQGQLGEAQDTFFKAQSECVRHKGDKTLLEAELESLKRKLATVEMKSKQMENNLHATYTAEIDRLEDRLRLFADKVDEGRAQESRANDLQAEIRAKMNDLKTLESKIMSSENLRKEQDIRQQSLEAQLRSSELQHRQLDMRHRSLEQEFARCSSELAALKRVKGQSEEEMREVALQNAQLQSDKQELRHTLSSLENRLDAFSEMSELCKRQKRELERANNQLDESGRRVIDLERNHRILSDDCANTENRIKGISQRMAALLARDGENRQIIIVANSRITELYNLARDLQSKYQQEELRADHLQRDFTGVAPKRPNYASTDVPYAAAPVVPLPMPMDAGGPVPSTPSGAHGSGYNYSGGGGGGGGGGGSVTNGYSAGVVAAARSLVSPGALAASSPAAFAAASDALRPDASSVSPMVSPTPPLFPRSTSSQERGDFRALSFTKEGGFGVGVGVGGGEGEGAPGTASTVVSRGSLSTGDSQLATQLGLGRDFDVEEQ